MKDKPGTIPDIERVLGENPDRPHTAKEILELAGEQLNTKSLTPITVVQRDIARHIIRFGDESTIVRVTPGQFMLRENAVKLYTLASTPRIWIEAYGLLPATVKLAQMRRSGNG